MDESKLAERANVKFQTIERCGPSKNQPLFRRHQQDHNLFQPCDDCNHPSNLQKQILSNNHGANFQQSSLEQSEEQQDNDTESNNSTSRQDSILDQCCPANAINQNYCPQQDAYIYPSVPSSTVESMSQDKLIELPDPKPSNHQRQSDQPEAQHPPNGTPLIDQAHSSLMNHHNDQPNLTNGRLAGESIANEASQVVNSFAEHQQAAIELEKDFSELPVEHQQPHSTGRDLDNRQQQRAVVKRFHKSDNGDLSSAPAPDVKIGQRVVFREYYGSEFGTIRWIGRVPQISSEWTVGVEFDNPIGEGDGSLNGRRYFVAKDCFAKFLPLNHVALVDQHVGRPEPGTMISVMSSSVKPGQMISIQRVSTVHVQHCFLNAPHRGAGADFLGAVNNRLHCQCPSCGPCAHIVKPPRTERLKVGKNATHMCQFSTYTCCGMESQDKALCTYLGNRITSTPPPSEYMQSTSLIRNDSASIEHSWTETARHVNNSNQKHPNPPWNHCTTSVHSKSAQRSGRRHRGQKKSRSKTTSELQPNIVSDVNSDKPTISSAGNHGTNPDQHTDGRGTDSMALGDPKHCRGLDSLVYSQLTIADKHEASLEFSKEYQSTQSSLEIGQKTRQNYGMSQSGSFTYDDHALTVNDNSAVSRGKEIAKSKSNECLLLRLDSPSDLGAEVDLPKVPQVLHRDSIDNRYLIPTDNAVESHLESDLEELSRARYGSCKKRGNQAGNLKIFKSIRSLVPCLSSKSSHSHLKNQNHYGTLKFIQKPSMTELSHEYNSERVSYACHETTCADCKQHNQASSNYGEYLAPQDYCSWGCGSQEKPKRQNSSSSDRGFSSASQNSINVASSLVNCSPTNSYELNQYHKTVSTRVVKSDASTTNEDLIELRSTIFEMNSEADLMGN